MAERLAGRFRNKGESADDLAQVAALGLVKAVDRFDPARGHAFASFAIPTVVGELKRHFRDHLWAMHVPRRIQELRMCVRGARSVMEQELGGRSPTVAEMCERTGLTEAEVLTGLEASACCEPVSLDGPLAGTEEGRLVEILGGEDGDLDLVVLRESLRPLLAELSERDRRVLYLRFFADLTQSQIADALGVSQMQISRMLCRLCGQLRQGLLGSA